MAAVKRTLSRFRRGSDDEEKRDDESPRISPEDFDRVSAIDGVEEREGIDPDETDADDGPGRPTVWIGLAVASLGGLGAAVNKNVQHRKAVKEAKKEEPWRVEEEETSPHPDDTGTASLVGFVFVAIVNALGKRFERDSWE